MEIATSCVNVMQWMVCPLVVLDVWQIQQEVLSNTLVTHQLGRVHGLGGEFTDHRVHSVMYVKRKKAF
jgi:hypothetical protein